MKRLKRCMAMLLCFVMLVGMVPIQALATETVASGTCGENLTWVLDDEGTLTISGTGGMYQSRSYLSWYSNRSSITSAIIEDGVTSIGDRAFIECASLSSVDIPDSVTFIGGQAFDGCTSLSSVDIPDSVTFIATQTFHGCTNLSNVDISDSATYIGSYAFQGCTSLGSVDIPDSVTSIKEWAFYGCKSLSSVDIPESVTSIGGSAFAYCSNLTSVIIPESVTSIGGNAFGDCVNLTSINIPDGVISIENSTFGDCSNLTSINIPESVTSIGDSAFEGCARLRSVDIPDSVTSIGRFAFYGCSLTSINIPNGVTSIGDKTFYECTSLSSIDIPESVTSIGSSAFYGCSNLIDIYYGGTEEQWKAISIGRDNAALTNATIHYNSTGPDDEGIKNSYGNVRYFSEWDSENQIAYFGADPEEDFLNFGSQVTEETDTSFLENVDELVGIYVLAETKKRDDGMLLPDTLLSIKPVETKTGKVTSANDTSIIIDGITYDTPEDLMFPSRYANTKVMYHLYSGKIVGIEILEDYNKSDSGGSSPSYPEFDYNAPVTEPTNEEELLRIYAENWLEKYDEFMEAVKEEVKKYSTTKDAIRAATIAAEASRMQREDGSSNSKYLTFSSDFPFAYKKEAYTALATLLYDEAADDFDFSEGIDDASIVNSVMKSLYKSTKTIEFDNITIRVHVLQAGNAKFGDLICTVNNKNKSYSAVICSTQAEIEDTMNSFCNELNELGIESVHNVYSAIVEDICNVALTSLTTEYITETVANMEDMFLIKEKDEFLKIGVGDLTGTLHNCYDFFDDMIQTITNGRTEDFEECLDNVESIEFVDASANSKIRKKLKALNKAAEKLNEAVSDYLAGELEVSDFELLWKSTFNCPVNVAVYDSTGTQIGYVGEDDIWYEDTIVIEENGGSKTIYSLTDEKLSFEITGTDYGTLSCSFEEYDENNVPIGRLNYYDISLTPGQKYTTAMTDDLLSNSKLMAIRTENKSILADEYISVNESANVDISCTIVGDGINGGTVTGAGTFVRGDAAVLFAIPDEGYRFVGWFVEDTLQCTSKVYEFTAREDVNVVAEFWPIEYMDDATLGDVNVDGVTTNADLIMMARYIVGLDESDSVKQYGDINSDSQITNADLIALARIIVGLE